MFSWNWEKLKVVVKELLTLKKKNRIKKQDCSISASRTGKNDLFDFSTLFGTFICVQYFFDLVSNRTSNKKYLLQLIKRRSKDHRNNNSREHALNFDQW